jgi:hypothetical protein
VVKKENNMSQTDLLTAIATASDDLNAIAKQLKKRPVTKSMLQTIAADLERLVIELQKGE